MAGFGGAVKLTGESEYRKALKAISQDLKELSAETKLVSAQYASNAKSIEALTAKQTALTKQYEAQVSKVNLLKSQYASMTAEQDKNKAKHEALVKTYKEESDKLVQIGKECGTTSAEYKLQAGYVNGLATEVNKSSKAIEQNETQMSRLRTELTNATTEMVKTENELNSLDAEIKDVSDSSQDLGDDIKGAGDKAKKASKDGFTVFKGILANLGATVIKEAVNGLKKLGSQLISVGKDAFNAYSEFEQLTGGVETLFGNSAKTVKEYAANAYKTAGMSANEYMSTVTGFSSSLLKSLKGDTEKAAQYADKAIRDMSDNANKMGTSIDLIQNAYQGFAKENYTMLDNLKLGFAGTKEGAQQLIKEAEKLDSTFKAQRDSSGKLTLAYADMVDAIHIVQTNMGITGTTAKEAESTIEGSTMSMKAAWENLLVAIADDNANLSKSVKQFTDSAETFLKNAAPRVKKIVEGIFTAAKKLAKKYMPEVYKTVYPVLEKLTKALKDIVTFITKNFSVIAPTVMTAVAAFAAFNATLAISKTVTTVTTALSALTAGVGLATKATTVFNAVLSSNPIMAVVTAVLALVAAVTLLSSKTKDEAVEAFEEQKQALQEQKDAIQENVDAWNDLKDAQQKNVDASMTEVSYLQSLKNELVDITDANGKVKDGYEERASFIVSQLSNALGIEIEMTDGIIENYTGMINAIDELMKKKKAEIILNSQEALYSEALTNRAEALRKLNELQDDVNEKKERVAKINQEIAYWEQKATEYQKANDYVNYQQATTNLASYKDELKSVNSELATSEDLYNQQEALVQEYAYNIGIYEKNMELAHAGHYDEMININWNYVSEYKNAEDAQAQILQDSIDNEKTNLDILYKLKEKSGSDIYDQQIKQSEERIAQLEDEMKQYVATTKKGTDEATVVWSDSLDDQLSELTGSKVEFRAAAGGLVQMYVDGEKTGLPKSKETWAQIVTDSINEVSTRYTDSKKAGEDLIQGVNDGVANERKQNGAFGAISNFGNKLLNTLKRTLKEASPSKATKDMGLFLDEGVTEGVKKGSKSTLKQVATFGKSIVDTFNDELKDGTNIGEFTSDINSELKGLKPEIDLGGVNYGAASLDGINSGSITGALNYQAMINAFKEALGQMTVELDDRQVGKFVKKTVATAIYT